MSHIRSVHVNDEFELSCPVGGCSSIYSNVNSMCSHIYQKHSSSSRSRDVPGPSVPPEVAQPTGFSSDVMMDLSLPESVSHDVDQLQHRDEYKQKKKSILFLLQLKEEQMLTQSALNDVVAGCQEVFKHTVGQLKAGVSRSFARNGINSECVEEINCIFDEAYDLFSGLESAYLQEKFIVQELGCVISQNTIEYTPKNSHYSERSSHYSKESSHYGTVVGTFFGVYILYARKECT